MSATRSKTNRKKKVQKLAKNLPLLQGKLKQQVDDLWINKFTDQNDIAHQIHEIKKLKQECEELKKLIHQLDYANLKTKIDLYQAQYNIIEIVYSILLNADQRIDLLDQAKSTFFKLIELCDRNPADDCDAKTALNNIMLLALSPYTKTHKEEADYQNTHIIALILIQIINSATNVKPFSMALNILQQYLKEAEKHINQNNFKKSIESFKKQMAAPTLPPHLQQIKATIAMLCANLSRLIMEKDLGDTQTFCDNIEKYIHSSVYSEFLLEEQKNYEIIKQKLIAAKAEKNILSASKKTNDHISDLNQALLPTPDNDNIDINKISTIDVALDKITAFLQQCEQYPLHIKSNIRIASVIFQNIDLLIEKIDLLYKIELTTKTPQRGKNKKLKAKTSFEHIQNSINSIFLNYIDKIIITHTHLSPSDMQAYLYALGGILFNFKNISHLRTVVTDFTNEYVLTVNNKLIDFYRAECHKISHHTANQDYSAAQKALTFHLSQTYANPNFVVFFLKESFVTSLPEQMAMFRFEHPNIVFISEKDSYLYFYETYDSCKKILIHDMAKLIKRIQPWEVNNQDGVKCYQGLHKGINIRHELYNIFHYQLNYWLIENQIEATLNQLQTYLRQFYHVEFPTLEANKRDNHEKESTEDIDLLFKEVEEKIVETTEAILCANNSVANADIEKTRVKLFKDLLKSISSKINQLTESLIDPKLHHYIPKFICLINTLTEILVGNSLISMKQLPQAIISLAKRDLKDSPMPSEQALSLTHLYLSDFRKILIGHSYRLVNKYFPNHCADLNTSYKTVVETNNYLINSLLVSEPNTLDPHVYKLNILGELLIRGDLKQVSVLVDLISFYTINHREEEDVIFLSQFNLFYYCVARTLTALHNHLAKEAMPVKASPLNLTIEIQSLLFTINNSKYLNSDYNKLISNFFKFSFAAYSTDTNKKISILNLFKNIFKECVVFNILSPDQSSTINQILLSTIREEINALDLKLSTLKNDIDSILGLEKKIKRLKTLENQIIPAKVRKITAQQQRVNSNSARALLSKEKLIDATKKLEIAKARVIAATLAKTQAILTSKQKKQELAQRTLMLAEKKLLEARGKSETAKEKLYAAKAKAQLCQESENIALAKQDTARQGLHAKLALVIEQKKSQENELSAKISSLAQEEVKKIQITTGSNAKLDHKLEKLSLATHKVNAAKARLDKSTAREKKAIQVKEDAIANVAHAQEIIAQTTKTLDANRINQSVLTSKIYLLKHEIFLNSIPKIDLQKTIFSMPMIDLITQIVEGLPTLVYLKGSLVTQILLENIRFTASDIDLYIPVTNYSQIDLFTKQFHQFNVVNEEINRYINMEAVVSNVSLQITFSFEQDQPSPIVLAQGKMLIMPKCTIFPHLPKSTLYALSPNLFLQDVSSSMFHFALNENLFLVQHFSNDVFFNYSYAIYNYLHKWLNLGNSINDVSDYSHPQYVNHLALKGSNYLSYYYYSLLSSDDDIRAYKEIIRFVKNRQLNNNYAFPFIEAFVKALAHHLNCKLNSPERQAQFIAEVTHDLINHYSYASDEKLNSLYAKQLIIPIKKTLKGTYKTYLEKIYQENNTQLFHEQQMYTAPNNVPFNSASQLFSRPISEVASNNQTNPQRNSRPNHLSMPSNQGLGTRPVYQGTIFTQPQVQHQPAFVMPARASSQYLGSAQQTPIPAEYSLFSSSNNFHSLNFATHPEQPGPGNRRGDKHK